MFGSPSKELKTAQTLYEKGIVYNSRADYALAEESFLKALVIFTKLNDKEKIAATEESLGNVCLNKNHFETSLDHFQKAVRMHLESRNKESAGNVALQMGDVYLIDLQVK
jgi:tetratricopeptide (TPR) repeat protein